MTPVADPDLTPGGLHHVLGLLKLAPHPGHLLHQPPVVRLSLFPQLTNKKINQWPGQWLNLKVLNIILWAS